MKLKYKLLFGGWIMVILLLFFFPSAVFADTVLDQFGSVSYSNNDGTTTWSTNWIEINEADGPNSGDERVTGGVLRVQDNDGGGEGVEREVNLSGAISATLSFQYRRNRLDNSNDYVTIEVSGDGGGSWTELDRFAGPNNDGSYQPVSYNIDAYISANTKIRFLSSSNLGNNDRVYFDNVSIDFVRPSNPSVTSLTLTSLDPSTANTVVSWALSFDQIVTGVDLTDFVLVEAGGATGASLISVSGSGTTWTITANTGTSDTGSLGLNLVDDDSIVNTVGNPLGGAGLGNGDFTGDTYTLLPPAPLLNKAASASAAVLGDVVTFTITVTNPYVDPLTNLSVTDNLPAGMTYVSHVATLGTLGIVGQTATWTIPTLPAMGSAQLTLAVSLSQTGPLTNTVSSPGAASASATLLVLASAVTHFRMDEPVGSWTGAAGEVLDSGGTALHGRRLISTPPTTTNVVDPVPSIASEHASVVGGFCNAAEFDGRAIVEVADSPNFDYTTQLSASAWIYPTAYPTGGNLYSILSNDVNYEFHLNSSGKLFWWWNASTLTSATTIPLNQWTHVAITFDSSSGVRRQRIYINGVQDGNTNNWQGTLAPNNCNFYIGGDVATGAACSIISSRNFRGMIDEAKLYSFELSQSEVVADMTLGRSCSGTFDHLRIEHDGVASVCAPERVTVKACLDSSCTTLYPGSVTVNLAPTGWVGGDTFTFSGGIGTRQLSRSTSGNITLGSNSVSPTPATNTRCFKGGTETCTMNFASASCAFDAVEPGAAPQSPIFTKLAGIPFDIDVLALLSPTSINTGYTGNVAIDLVDATGVVCPTGSGLNTATNILFAGGDAGRKTVSFSYPAAARDVRVRATVGASAPACSTDNFSIRPQSFTLSSGTATNTALSGLPVIKAGAPFDLNAVAVAGYDGAPLIDSSKVNGTPNAGTLSGTFTPAPASTGTASGAGFTYSEVGHFGLEQNAVYDDSFTTVDQPDDCLPGYSNLSTAGKYGCSIGSLSVPLDVGSSGFGRFIPARFNLSANMPLLNDTCSGGFTYLGQPFSFLLEPEVTLTALNAAGTTTLNYAGSYWKQNSTLGGRTYSNNAATSATLTVANVGSVSWSGTSTVDGIGLVSIAGEQLRYLKPAVAEGPFATDLDLNFTANDFTDSDGVCYDPNNNGTCDSYQIAGIGSTQQRYGRMLLQNAYGLETRPLSIPVQTEFFNGSVFVPNDLDTCTPYDSVSLQLSNFQGNLTLGTTTASGSGILAAGIGSSLSLSAPGVGHEGSVDLELDLSQATGLNLEWLQPGGINPKAKATFGIFKGNPRLIYLRESVR